MFLRVVPCDGCLADKYILTGVVAIYKVAPIFNNKSFNGSRLASIYVFLNTDKASQHLLTVSCYLLILRECVVVRFPASFSVWPQSAADLQVIVLEASSFIVYLEHVSLGEQLQLLLGSEAF